MRSSRRTPSVGLIEVSITARGGGNSPIYGIIQDLSKQQNRRNFDTVSDAIQIYDPSLPLNCLKPN